MRLAPETPEQALLTVAALHILALEAVVQPRCRGRLFHPRPSYQPLGLAGGRCARVDKTDPTPPSKRSSIATR